MFKHLKQFLAAVLAVSFLTGCAQIPTNGLIKTGQDLQPALESDFLYYSPTGPVEDATKYEILAGFLNAGTGPQNDYSTAREFLSEDLRANWKPSQRTLIQAGSRLLTVNSDNSASASISVSAQIGDQGEFESLPANSTEYLNFKFIKEDGQWRISSAPNLTVVIEPVFEVIFRSYSVYFYDNEFEYLVPDVRWFPSRASTTTRLVDALLNGPSDWLAPAVTSAIPAGTELAVNAVTVNQGLASVDLSAAALKATVGKRPYMEAQIRETLLPLSSVYNVQVLIEQTPQDIQDINSLVPAIRSTSPVVLVDGNLKHADLSASTDVIGAKPILQQLDSTEFALTDDEKYLLLRTSDGIYSRRFGILGAKTDRLVAGTDFLAPAIDRQNFAWAMPSAANSPVFVFDSLGKQVQFASGWLHGLERSQFSISPEGSRAAVIAGTGANRRLYVMSIIRDQFGKPISFGLPVKPYVEISSVTSVSWVGLTSLAILDQGIGEYTTPKILTIGGLSRALPQVLHAKAIIGSNPVSSLFIQTDENEFFQYRSAFWSKVSSNVLAMHFPGM
ncbi:MAG: hypothetical protein RIQ31_730 [Actinomycetota bacterium]